MMATIIAKEKIDLKNLCIDEPVILKFKNKKVCSDL